MRHLTLLTLSLSLLLASACTMFKAEEAPQPVAVPKPIAVPVGKNWQVVEEAPQLTNERTNKLPFQTEESLLPEGATTAPPEDKRRLETPR